VATIADWLRQALPDLQVHNVTDDPAYWECDIDLVCQLDGHRFTVEIKADQRATTTGNLFLETISVEARPSPGWLTRTEADLLFYHCAAPPSRIRPPHCPTDCLYVFVVERLREWFHAERKRLLHTRPELAQQTRVDKATFDQTWRIRATHTIDASSGDYQHTTLGWTVPLAYVRERYFEDSYGEHAGRMRELMIITGVAHHLDTLADMLRRYVTWARRREEQP